MFHAAGSEHLITGIVIGKRLRSLQRQWDVLQHPVILFSVAEIVYHVFVTLSIDTYAYVVDEFFHEHLSKKEIVLLYSHENQIPLEGLLVPGLAAWPAC
jgi:hypothetical protein